MSLQSAPVSDPFVTNGPVGVEAPQESRSLPNGQPVLSILIEWENVLVAAEDRSLRMLEELGRQVGELGDAAEILILFNPDQVPQQAVSEVVAQHLRVDPPSAAPIARTVAAPGLHYYDLRNHGVHIARGEIIVCLDSDVIPEPGWLDALTSPLRTDPGVHFVGGETYLDHTGSFFDKAFALGWIFPLRSSDDTLRPGQGRQFWANNMACRRSFFLDNPYPTDPGIHESRNACRRLKKNLASKGVPVWRAGAARVSHPAPEGWGKALLHGLVEGRDNAILFKERGYGRARQSLRAIGFACGRMKQAVRNGLDKDGPIPVPAWQLPGIILILIPYYLMTIVGVWAHAWLPARVWSRWSI